jgi:hypothetical protein
MAIGAAALLIPMIPGVIQIVRELVDIMRSPDLTKEETAAKLDAIAVRLDARVAEIETMILPEPRVEGEE